MAEAATAAEPNVRYFCHMCNVEINIPTNTEYICPLCAGGFVEELPANLQNIAHSIPTSGGASTNANTPTRRSNNVLFPDDLAALRGEIATLLMSRNGPNVEISFSGNRRGNQTGNASGNGGGANSSSSGSNNSSGSNISGNGGGTGNGGTAGGRVRAPNMDRLDNVLLDFLQSLSGGDVETPFRNSDMVYLGNLGDYAWGREGIDTIVTQLLNQMETSGPPPLSKSKIAEIPTVEIGTDEVDKKIQCSVCWEDFILKESVRRLPCTHIYHENCITPWLKLHGTCPICRKSLIDESNTMESNIDTDRIRRRADRSNTDIGNMSSNNFANNSTTTNTARGASNQGGTSQSHQNNIFGFENEPFNDLD